LQARQGLLIRAHRSYAHWKPRIEPSDQRERQVHAALFTFAEDQSEFSRIDAPCVLDGPINGERFKAYIAQFLVPTLKPGDMVIMENLGSHKGYAVRRAIGRREASFPAALQFLTSILSSRCSPS
jgi:hypothetical protein